jgi:DNA repair protein RadC
MSDNAASQTYYTIHDLPEATRPRERLARHGEASLSNEELIAIILRSGAEGLNVLDLATRLMRHYHNDLGELARASFEELQQHHGIGPAKAAQLLAAKELGKRMLYAAPERRPRVQSPQEAADLLMGELAYADQEYVKVILLDSRNYVIGTPTLYKGSLNAAHVRIGELFKEAIRRNAAAIIVAHNHPSGDPTPSPEDIVLTRRVVEAGRLLNIEVFDHLILGRTRWISLKERRQGFA